LYIPPPYASAVPSLVALAEFPLKVQLVRVGEQEL